MECLYSIVARSVQMDYSFQSHQYISRQGWTQLEDEKIDAFLEPSSDRMLELEELNLSITVPSAA